MKNGKKSFILIEVILAALVIVLSFVMVRGRSGKDFDKISVIIENSDDNQWSALKYGIKMAAKDQGVEVFFSSTAGDFTAGKLKNTIENELNNGADAIIVQPVSAPGIEKLLKKMEKKIPIMLVENNVEENKDSCVFSVIQADNYAMGIALAEELLKDYSGNIEGKTLGIISKSEHSEAARNRELGFKDGIKRTGARVGWSVSDFSGKEKENFLANQSKVNIVIALDDDSLTTAGEYAASNNFHGAFVYGIGNSTEAIHYLDIGILECLLVPDEFSVGYQSLTEISKRLKCYFYKMQSKLVSYDIIRREELFSKENQEILFTMSQ